MKSQVSAQRQRRPRLRRRRPQDAEIARISNKFEQDRLEFEKKVAESQKALSESKDAAEKDKPGYR
jgi:hypothetical protein